MKLCPIVDALCLHIITTTFCLHGVFLKLTGRCLRSVAITLVPCFDIYSNTLTFFYIIARFCNSL
ncbi:hypothetical protein J3Q64DRAFT_1750731 [Phycomyces blakesleeanus]|uniref:Uncharacterized protein n=1 Tax=Phycomyces blakesleeanus TaxID=4837 RepID=A0ABR3AYN4_PHYBL